MFEDHLSDMARQHTKAVSAIVRGSMVKRLHTQPTIHQETVSHHQGLIGSLMIATYPGIPRKLLVYGLTHDLGEYLTGDLPSPVKRAVPELKGHLDKAESDYLIAHGFSIPELTDEERFLFKVYDNLAGMVSAYQEALMGNRNMKLVFNNFYDYYQDLQKSRLRQRPVDGSDKDMREALKYVWLVVSGLRSWFDAN
jgi:5'-deoxynucleotidase YfbR-like HD superfamily hydrolase